MKLSIIMPVYNEEGTLEEIVSRVKKANLPHGVTREIIIVDDGSRDKSVEIAQGIEGVKLMKHQENKGKGASVRTGVEGAAGELIIIQDADLEYDPNDYSRLLRPILSNKAEVVYGTRLKNCPLRIFGEERTPFLTHYFGNKFLSLITSLLYGNKLTDMETCYKIFTKKALEGIKIKSNRFEFEPEITAKILKKGVKIREIPIETKPRSYAEGKKITWKDGFFALWTLIKYKFID